MRVMHRSLTTPHYVHAGDKSCVNSANRVQNILIYIVRHLTMVEMKIDTERPTTWVGSLLGAPFMTAEMRQWSNERRTRWGEPQANDSYMESMQKFWNLVPATITAYFDDGMYFGAEVIVDLIDVAIFKLMDQGGVEAAWAKFERSWGGERDTRATRISQSEWGPRTDGPIDILGKLHSICFRTRGDKPSRIAEFNALNHLLVTQANSNPGRQVFTAACRRSQGIGNYVTMQAPQARAFMNPLIRALKGVDAWSHRRKRPASHTAGRGQAVLMGEAAYFGAATLHSGSDGEKRTMEKSWSNLQLGDMCVLPDDADSELAALGRSVTEFNTIAWMPMRAPPSQDAIYILQDAAGFSDEEPGPRGCGAWFYCKEWNTIKWVAEVWREDVLKACHSTLLEGSNGNKNLRYAHYAWPRRSAYIEVFDNLAVTEVFRRLGASSRAMQELVDDRTPLIREITEQGSRVLTFWQERALGQIADDTSWGEP